MAVDKKLRELVSAGWVRERHVGHEEWVAPNGTQHMVSMEEAWELHLKGEVGLPEPEEMARELEEGGWKRESAQVWRIPGGGLVRGPAYAWKQMKLGVGKVAETE